MRAGCQTQRVDRFPVDPYRRGGTSTARLKTGAGDPHDEALRWARRVFRPTNAGWGAQVGRRFER